MGNVIATVEWSSDPPNNPHYFLCVCHTLRRYKSVKLADSTHYQTKFDSSASFACAHDTWTRYAGSVWWWNGKDDDARTLRQVGDVIRANLEAQGARNVTVIVTGADS